jgi:hypothetical protein
VWQLAVVVAWQAFGRRLAGIVGRVAGPIGGGDVLQVKQVNVELGWGPAKVSGVWEPESAERDAAWELYVELVTRVAVVPLGPGEGVLREALGSLYSLFGSTRDILRRGGPAVARPAPEGRLRFGYLAVWL